MREGEREREVDDYGSRSERLIRKRYPGWRWRVARGGDDGGGSGGPTPLS